MSVLLPVRALALVQCLQPLIFLNRHHHDDGASMLGDRHRLGPSEVDQPSEAVFRVFRAQGLHATPHQ